ncbi:ribonuclease HII [Flavobacteriaceae bacterium]|jgi:ribonuclease HII|nr:ribonuclease HII [Flavobacteriaceae bacterium]MDA7711305.1 ribonuclease HII [Flavobacteriaceae bacterium]
MLEIQLQPGLEAGTDEAGRGCLAGPVTAAAVILPETVNLPLLNDSKKLTERQRFLLRPLIEEQALAYAITFVSPEEIDQINILNASIKAMHLALEQLALTPEHIVVDGNRFKPFKNIPHQCIIKGDGKFQNIAAASILAKTYRDDYMRELSKTFPQYGWKQNKGYPTKNHRNAIVIHGKTKHHRNSFQLLPKQAELPFPKP